MIKDISKELLLEAVSKSNNFYLLLKFLNIKESTGNRNIIKDLLHTYDINTDHFYNKCITREMYELNPKYCKTCGNKLTYELRNNIFCSHSCSAIYNSSSIIHNKDKYFCKLCGKELNNSHSIYCSLECCNKDKYDSYIAAWKNGEISGTIGTDNISHRIRRYLFDKYNNSCQICGWSIVNKFTGNVPLQIHHIDGNCLNNKENNLQLLCPNCHSLTETFGSRNKGHCTRKDKRVR